MIEMILTRATTINGVRSAVGDRIFVEVGQATDLLQSGRARLADPADLALVIDRTEPQRRPLFGRLVMTRQR